MSTLSKIGVGLVGFGLGGSVFHAPFIEANDGLDLRAVVSRDPAKVHALLPSVAVLTSIGELLESNDIELVVVASPDDLHADHAIASMEAGKNVLVDKPLATSLLDAERVAQVAERTGRKLTVFHNRRWDADFLTLEQLVSKGTLGRIVHYESHFDRWKPDIVNVWKDRRKGGSWFDLGPHLVDQALHLFGMPSAIQASFAAMRNQSEVPDWFHVIFEYPEMRVVLQSNSIALDNEVRFAVHGTQGSWIKNGLDSQESCIAAGGKTTDAGFGFDPTQGRLTLASNRAGHAKIPNETGNYGQFWRLLVEWLRGSGPNPVPVSDALAVMKILDAGMKSDTEGCRIRF